MATHAFRLRPIMKQGTAAGIRETWTHYPSVEDAHAGAKLMYSKRRTIDQIRNLVPGARPASRRHFALWSEKNAMNRKAKWDN